MVEIRGRLVLPDNDLLGYGYLEARFEPDPGRAYSALDIDCVSCEAPAGTPCGPRLCRERFDLALMLIADGELQSSGPATRKDAACANCGKRRLNGRPLPCDKADHRCVKVVSDRRCRYAVVPSGELCDHHKSLYAGNQLKQRAPETPKRKVGRPKGSQPAPPRPAGLETRGGPGKLSDQDRATIVQKYRDGATIAALSREFDVSATAIRYSLNKAGARNSAA